MDYKEWESLKTGDRVKRLLKVKELSLQTVVLVEWLNLIMEPLKELLMVICAESNHNRGVLMSRINKTKNRLMEVWDDLDEAYERTERSLEKLSVMSNLSDELEQEMNNFDISAISSLKQHVEIMLSNEAFEV